MDVCLLRALSLVSSCSYFEAFCPLIYGNIMSKCNTMVDEWEQVLKGWMDEINNEKRTGTANEVTLASRLFFHSGSMFSFSPQC